MVSTFGLRRIEFSSLLTLFSLIRPLGWVVTVLLRVALNSVSAVMVGDMKEMITRMAVFKGFLSLSRDDRCANGECRMTLDAELPIKKDWVERTRAQLI